MTRQQHGVISLGLIERAESGYGALDLAGVVIPLMLILIFPQFWLKSNLPLLAIFWGLLLIAGIEITGKVCKGCGNRHCPLASTGGLK